MIIGSTSYKVVRINIMWKFIQYHVKSCGFYYCFQHFIENVGPTLIRPRNINWQDWKYTSFVIFICYSQNIQRHSAIGRD